MKNQAAKLNIDDYRKDTGEKLDVWVTSVNLEKKHQAFLEKEKINLSKLVRDTLNGIMPSEPEDPKK